MGDIEKVISCINFGTWRFHSCPGAPWQEQTKLHDAEIWHDHRCDGNCDATRHVEKFRAEGRLAGKPRHKIRAATG